MLFEFNKRWIILDLVDWALQVLRTFNTSLKKSLFIVFCVDNGDEQQQ